MEDDKNDKDDKDNKQNKDNDEDSETEYGLVDALKNNIWIYFMIRMGKMEERKSFNRLSLFSEIFVQVLLYNIKYHIKSRVYNIFNKRNS